MQSTAIQQILVPLDLSPFADSATACACSLAKRHHAQVEGIVVLDLPEIMGTDIPYNAWMLPAGVKLSQERHDEAKQRISDAMERFAGACESRSAHPHGVGFFAAKCVRHSKIPVLLTRRRHEKPFKRITACVDFSESTHEVLALAARIAADEGAELQVLHAVSPPWMRGTHVLHNLQTTEDEAYKAQFREVLGEQMEAACKNLPTEAVPHTIEHPNESQAIIGFLKENESDLAVVGRSGSAIKQFLIGTTAERIIHRSPCSVLVVPNSHA